MSRAWWYLLFEKEEYVAKDGKVKTRLVPNKHFFEETTTFLLEMADSGVTALKQFAEEYEHTELTRLTVKDQEPLKISVTGPRSFVAASVGGAPSDDGMQVANRFIQMPIDEKTTKHEKVALMTDNFLIGRDIQRDMRVKIIKRAFELLYKDGLNVVVRPPNEEVQKLIRELGIKLVKAVIITQVSQFHALCQCGAFENRFARDDPGICEITVKDVLEAWYLFNSFEKSITSKLTTAEYNILKAIEQISYTYTTVASTLDGGTTEEVIKQGTRGLAQNEIAKKANVGIASVSRALKCKAAPYGKMLEAGFVTYEYNRHVRATVFSRTADGDAILNGNLGLSVEIDEQKYETLSIIPSIPNNSKGLWNYENGKLLIKDDSNEYVDIYIYKFHNSINNREGLGGIESDNEIDSENISHHENIPLPLEKVELWNSENESVKTTSESETNTVPPPEEFHTLLESNGILLPKVESEENHIKSKKYNLFDDYNIRFAALRQIIAHHHDELDNSDYDAMVTSAYNLILWNSKDFIDGDSLEDRILNDDLLSDIKNVIADIVSGGG